MPNNAQEEMKATMDKLRTDYIARTKEMTVKLESFAALCEKNELKETERQELKEIAHKYVGTGATYGFLFLTDAAREIEKLLDENIMIEAKKLEKPIHNMIDVCQGLEAERHGDVEASSLSTHLDSSNAGREGEKRPGKRPTVVVVDDDENILAVLATLLEKDVNIFTGKNAEDARRLMLEHKPGLVILDDMMKDSISGMKFMEEIRGDPELSKIPVIMLTASDKTEEVMRGLMAGAVDYVVKPFVPEELAEKVRTHLSRHAARVLIVEDDKNVRLLLEFKFSNAGCTVVSCENGIQALEAVRKQTPDIVILDRMMPGMDGIAVLRAMRKIPSLEDIPVIFLTAKKLETEVIEGLRVGAADYIIKPFHPDEVVMRVSQALRRQRKK
ncbi:MAG: response regulator [Bdellovibrionales bacterium]